MEDKRMDIEKVKAYSCPIEAAMGVIGGKYKAIILYYLIKSTMRYNEIQKEIPQATPKMLSQQLKVLEADGIINRVLYPVVPPKTEYSLTELGKTLIPAINTLVEWGDSYFEALGVPNPCKE